MSDLPPWRVVGSRYVLESPWLSVRADECVTAEGVVIAPFYVTEQPDFVMVVAIDTEDRVILIEQYRHGRRVISRELPSGAVDAGDPDPVSAGRRELLEETGYAADDWRLVATLAPNPGNQTNRCQVVLARGARLVGTPVDDPTELVRVVPVAVGDAVAMAMAGEMIQVMHVAALAIALTPLGLWRAS